MRVPRGINITKAGNWVLRVKKNVYGQKQAGRVWNKYMVEKLTSPEVGFIQSKHDECVFYKGKRNLRTVHGRQHPGRPRPPGTARHHQAHRRIRIKDHPGRNYRGLPRRQHRSARRQKIPSNPAETHRSDSKGSQIRPTKCYAPLNAISRIRGAGGIPNSKPFDRHFHYRSILGKLQYLETTRMDISYNVHQ